VLLQDSKQLERAEAVFRTTLIHAEQALGPMRPHTLTIVFNLGWCLWQSGRLRSAEAFFRRELAACQTTKGAAHPDTIRSRKTLARLLKEQGRNLDEELEKADEAKEAERDAQEEEEEEGEAGLDDLGLGADEYLEGDGSIVVVVDDDLNV
jgi:tetratricopeptide (TPR) repeat protein